MTRHRDPVRHGDVLLKPIARIPKGDRKEIPREHGRPVLALGEATGHRHVIVGECEAVTVADRAFLRMIERGQIVHYADPAHSAVSTDHDTLAVPAGAYEIIQPRQYLYGEQVRVQD